MANKRLIDANALYEKMEQRFQRSTAWAHKAFGTALDDVVDAPTVDAVEVVRCKDCRWFDKTGYDEDNAHEEDLSLHMGWCANWRRGTQACAFCSYGERKDNERKAD